MLFVKRGAKVRSLFILPNFFIVLKTLILKNRIGMCYRISIDYITYADGLVLTSYHLLLQHGFPHYKTLFYIIIVMYYTEEILNLFGYIKLPAGALYIR